MLGTVFSGKRLGCRLVAGLPSLIQIYDCNHYFTEAQNRWIRPQASSRIACEVA